MNVIDVINFLIFVEELKIKFDQNVRHFFRTLQHIFHYLLVENMSLDMTQYK